MIVQQKFYFCIILFQSLSRLTFSSSHKDGAGDDEKHRQREFERLILGRYTLKTNLMNQDYHEFLKAMEFSDAEQEQIRMSKPVRIAYSKLKGNNTFQLFYTVGSGAHHLEKKTRFEPGKEVMDTVPGFDKRSFKLTITFHGNNTVKRLEKHMGFDCHHVAIHDKKGFTMNYECKNVTATHRFKKEKIRSDKNIMKHFWSDK